MDRSLVQKYFSENSDAWFATSYETDGYIYPIAALRTNRVLNLLSNMFPANAAKIVDLGCGGGHLAVELALAGHQVVGIDQSEEMLSNAASSLQSMSEETRLNIRLVEANVLETGLETGYFDAVTSMGVIGYLPDDAGIFKEAARLLRNDGVFIVSCRNRLFNMVSLSDNTLREIEEGSAEQLVREILNLFQSVPRQSAFDFVRSLSEASNQILSEMDQTAKRPNDLSKTPFTTSIQARQHTPRGLTDTARECGFENEGFIGVHPHLMMASFNELLPPYVFNNLSDALNVLDNHPLSLIWSSVFIGVFRKQG